MHVVHSMAGSCHTAKTTIFMRYYDRRNERQNELCMRIMRVVVEGT